MLGSLSYEELLKNSNDLLTSSQSIRNIIEKHGDNLQDIISFCDSVDSYAKFIESNVSLNKDADMVLQFMINKNKKK